jgi:hypothetical protein
MSRQIRHANSLAKARRRNPGQQQKGIVTGVLWAKQTQALPEYAIPEVLSRIQGNVDHNITPRLDDVRIRILLRDKKRLR